MGDAPRSSTATLVSALRILSRDIQSDDGVANAAIAEAADRLTELSTWRTLDLLNRNALPIGRRVIVSRPSSVMAGTVEMVGELHPRPFLICGSVFHRLEDGDRWMPVPEAAP